jgi:hypothetical protein
MRRIHKVRPIAVKIERLSHHCWRCSRWAQMGSTARKTVCTPHNCSVGKSSIYRAGGTRIEPATCALGALGAVPRLVQLRTSRALNPLLEVRRRPGSSKHLQQHCSQLCSQSPLQASTGRHGGSSNWSTLFACSHRFCLGCCPFVRRSDSTLTIPRRGLATRQDKRALTYCARVVVATVLTWFEK